MISRAHKLRFRRRLRLQKLQVEELGQQAEERLERNFFRRLERLADVRRFVAVWILLLVLLGGCVAAQLRGLSSSYESLGPAPGGRYTEGILGSFTNANPVYATNPVDVAVSHLIFASLFTYDDHNHLVGDLAQDIQADSQGTTYTVHLRPNLTWQDGKPLTTADVLFTYQIIQNPDAGSPFNASWQGIKVAAIDPATITFTLPNELASFPYSLMTGILPQHLLGSVSMQALRTVPFDTQTPVGAGPFKMSSLEVVGSSAETREERVALDAFDGYHAGRPKLDKFIVRSFRDQTQMLQSFHNQEITAMAGLDTVPTNLQSDPSVHVYSLPLTAAMMTFFRTGDGVLSDVNVRRALVSATDTSSILKQIGYPTLPVREPLLQGQLGYNPAYAQAAFDLNAAKLMLDNAGWVRGADGIRQKNGQPLSFSLFTQDNTESSLVAGLLKTQWRAAGVDVQVTARDPAEFQAALSNHDYDALLYGISIGVDPDVYAYWDSKQADIRSDSWLNFSEYKSAIADTSLQAGRTRTDPALRVVKYQPFLRAWQTDAPAVGLYQPRLLYITHGTVYGLDERQINSDVDRYRNVQNWMIRERGISQAD
jgi:peptide/nickel transport system substrate-binding protein